MANSNSNKPLISAELYELYRQAYWEYTTMLLRIQGEVMHATTGNHRFDIDELSHRQIKARYRRIVRLVCECGRQRMKIQEKEWKLRELVVRPHE